MRGWMANWEIGSRGAGVIAGPCEKVSEVEIPRKGLWRSSVAVQNRAAAVQGVYYRLSTLGRGRAERRPRRCRERSTQQDVNYAFPSRVSARKVAPDGDPLAFRNRRGK